jgi:HK97 gp10 family phage protein
MPITAVQLSLEGAAEMRAALRELSDDSQREAVIDAARAGGEFLEPIVKQQVPVDTGFGKAQTTLKTKMTKLGVAESVISFGQAFYLFFVEFGTAKMTAKPFVRPTFDTNTERAAQAMIERFEKFLERRLPA